MKITFSKAKMAGVSLPLHSLHGILKLSVHISYVNCGN